LLAIGKLPTALRRAQSQSTWRARQKPPRPPLVYGNGKIGRIGMLACVVGTVACGAPRCLRQLSAAAGDVIDDMIAFSRSSYKVQCNALICIDIFDQCALRIDVSLLPQDRNYDQAMDVLKSGLGFQPTGRGAGR